MFCRDFEKIAGDLAAGRLMEAAKREGALRHASECPACAFWLKAERALEAGLRALGEDTEDREAPPHLKTALRAAFDKQAPPAPILTSARQRNSALKWIAAAALILIGVAVALSYRPAPPNQNAGVSSGKKPAPREQSPQPVTESGNQARKSGASVAGKTSAGRRARRHAATYGDMTRVNETLTDYIPLTYLADETAIESGIVLRVELPPSALITMGLPMNAERTGEPVKADLIIGDDGVARAVRFVEEDF